MTEGHEEALRKFARAWRLEGDWMLCASCRRHQPASKEETPIAHAAGCPNFKSTLPWKELKSILAVGAAGESMDQDGNPVAKEGSP